MAQSQKKQSSPHTLEIPRTLAPIVEAFSENSEEIAKTLLEQAAAAIYYEKNDDYCFESTPRPVTKQEIDGVYALMKVIRPKDIVEALHGAQIIVGHLLGMRKLAQSRFEDQNLGLKLLRLSNDAMERLERKRSGGQQNANVIYNNNGLSMQAIINPPNKE